MDKNRPAIKVVRLPAGAGGTQENCPLSILRKLYPCKFTGQVS